VLSSGFDEAYVRERVGPLPVAAFLAKPWRVEALLSIRRAVLGRDPGPGTA
jgi:hypothetical protein